MYRIFFAEKDTYITDRVISGDRVYQGNTGHAGTLDLLKLYGVSQSGSAPNIELSRALIKFDLSSLRSQLAAVGRTPADSTFNVQLKLHDIYGGQTTPSNFNLVVFPLSRSFDEGSGRDVGYYKDHDTANFLTASWNGSASTWFVSGANGKGFLGSSNIDIITSGNLGAGIVNFGLSQSFTTGKEDLNINVTRLVSATLAGLLPDCGFRLSFIQSEEDDNRSRFVKRFASRSAADRSLRPKLLVRWDDSVQDSRTNFKFDVSGTLYIYNHTESGLKNLVSGSNLAEITGTNCIKLRLETPVSGGVYTNTFLGSQLSTGTSFVTGTYFVSLALHSSDLQLGPQLAKSGSVKFDEYWTSVDGTVGYLTSSLTLNKQDVQTFGVVPVQHFVNITNGKDTYATDEIATIRVFIRRLDTVPLPKKIPQEVVTYVPGDAHFRVRDFNTGDIVIPFDETYKSTKLSSDSAGLAFILYIDSLAPGKVYTIDILVKEGSVKTVYRDVCSPFRVEDAQ